MRQLAQCVLFLMLLALGVATREMPEILDLDDDVSNDGMVVVPEDRLPSLSTVSQIVQNPARPTPTWPPCSAKISKNHFYFGPTLDASSKAGRDLLKLLALERK